jgi:hypothetical protein
MIGKPNIIFEYNGDRSRFAWLIPNIHSHYLFFLPLLYHILNCGIRVHAAELRTPEFAERVFEQIRGFGEYGLPRKPCRQFCADCLRHRMAKLKTGPLPSGRSGNFAKFDIQ